MLRKIFIFLRADLLDCIKLISSRFLSRLSKSPSSMAFITRSFVSGVFFLLRGSKRVIDYTCNLSGILNSENACCLPIICPFRTDKLDCTYFVNQYNEHTHEKSVYGENPTHNLKVWVPCSSTKETDQNIAATKSKKAQNTQNENPLRDNKNNELRCSLIYIKSLGYVSDSASSSPLVPVGFLSLPYVFILRFLAPQPS